MHRHFLLNNNFRPRPTAITNKRIKKAQEPPIKGANLESKKRPKWRLEVIFRSDARSSTHRGRQAVREVNKKKIERSPGTAQRALRPQ